MEKVNGEATEPYKSYKSIMDEIYKLKIKIEEKYRRSVKRLESNCDCSKYKCKRKDNQEDNNQEDNNQEQENQEDNNQEQENQEENNQEEENQEQDNQEDKKKLILKNEKII